MHRNEYEVLPEPGNERIDQNDIPYFIKNKDIYSILSRHLDIAALAKMAMTSKTAHMRFNYLLNNNPDLFLHAFLKTSKQQAARLLRSYPHITQIIEALRVRLPENYATYLLWALVSNINKIDDVMLEGCQEFFEDHQLILELQAVTILQNIKSISHSFKRLAQGQLTYNNTNELIAHDNRYLNCEGLELTNHAGGDIWLILRNMDFSWSNFRAAIFDRVHLVSANFMHADLSGVTFGQLFCMGIINFTGANLRGADLHKLQLKPSLHCQFIVSGANFEDAHFFPPTIMTIGELDQQLNDHLPYPYFSTGSSSPGMIQNRAIYNIIFPYVIADFIRTVNSYSDADYAAFLARPVVAAFVGNQTLQEYKMSLLLFAKKHSFFATPKNMLQYQLMDFLCLGLDCLRISTSAQRTLQREINLIRRENNAVGFRL